MMINTIVGQSLSYRLAQSLLSYHCTPRSTTGVPPFEFLLKRTLRTRLDIMKLVVSKVVTQNQAKQKDNYDGQTRVRELQLGSNVLVKNLPQGSKWIVGTVKEKVGLLSYMIELPNGMVQKHHIGHIQEEVNQNLIVNKMFTPKNKLIMHKSHLGYPKRHFPLIILLVLEKLPVG